MNDRFKFRVFDYDDNEMYDVIEIMYREDNTVVEWLNSKGKKRSAFIGEVPTVQCTGLKDKNGKLIYEGDVVKINENYYNYSAIEDFYINQNFVVEYFQPRAVYLLRPFEYKDSDVSGIYDLSPDFYEFLKWKPCGKLEEYTLQGIEVVDNIYENADLLESEE